MIMTQKFSTSTPKLGQSAYRRIWDPYLEPDGGVSCSKRITEGIHTIVNQVLRNIVIICGVVLHGLGTRYGWLKLLGILPFFRGGRRAKKFTVEKRWIHPDTKEALAQLVAKSITVKNN